MKNDKGNKFSKEVKNSRLLVTTNTMSLALHGTWIFEIVTLHMIVGHLHGSLLPLWTISIKCQLKVNVNSSKALSMDKYSSTT